jgi:histone H1/5
MTTENIETTDTAAAVAAQSADVAPEKAPARKGDSAKKSAPKGQKAAKGAKPKAAAPKKATPAKKAAKAPKQTTKAKEAAGPREGSKTAQVVAMLQRKNGATLAEIMSKMGWQKHYADVRIMPTCVGNPACGAGIAAMESA